MNSICMKRLKKVKFICGQGIRKTYIDTFYIAQNKSFAKNNYRIFADLPHLMLYSF